MCFCGVVTSYKKRNGHCDTSVAETLRPIGREVAYMHICCVAKPSVTIRETLRPIGREVAYMHICCVAKPSVTIRVAIPVRSSSSP